MEVSLVHKVNQHLLVRVVGDVLMENSKDFLNSVHEVIDPETDLKQVSFDFTRVLFVDSSGIGALIKLTAEMKKKSASIAIVGLSKNLRTVFQLSGISNILKVMTVEDFCFFYPEFMSYFERKS